MTDPTRKILNGGAAEVIRVVVTLAVTVIGAYIFIDARFEKVSDALARLDKRLAVIEGNRFTAHDGLLLSQQLSTIATVTREAEVAETRAVERIADVLEAQMQ